MPSPDLSQPLGSINGEFSEPLRVELPLDGLEAFRLASFGIEYQPTYGEIRFDRQCVTASLFSPMPHGTLVDRTTKWLERGQVFERKEREWR